MDAVSCIKCNTRANPVPYDYFRLSKAKDQCELDCPVTEGIDLALPSFEACVTCSDTNCKL